jgi:hypothetical protein
MSGGVSPKDGQSMDEALTELHAELSVGQWRVLPEQETQEHPMDETFTPAWWRGDEEASASFLSSMGVDLGKRG